MNLRRILKHLKIFLEEESEGAREEEEKSL